MIIFDYVFRNGEIEASNSPQSGAVFKITLPIASIEDKEVDIALIVNDKVLSYSLENALKVLDYRIKTLEMSDFENGIIAINDVFPKIIIVEGPLDNNLIKMEEIHRTRPELNIILLGDVPQKRAKAFHEKGIRVLGRPFEMTQIISTIVNLTFEPEISN